MIREGWACWIVASMCVAGFHANAQRPSEDQLFGTADAGTPLPGGTARAPVPSPPEPAASGPESSRDERALNGPASQDLFGSEPTRDDPLRIGGQIYLRSQVSGTEGTSVSDYRMVAPALVDGYFDARPNDRVRGMVVGRLTYDPTLDSNAANNAFGVPTSSNPGVLLDQLWVSFDLARTVFVTAGRQHVKWGVSRFWNPTDFLSPQRRDPLAVFDPRLGATMIKFHLPSESKGWNFYGIGLLDNAGPANTVGQVGGAVRGEMLLLGAELGAEAVFQPRRKPRFGLDLSSAVGRFDVYGEVSLRKGADAPLYRDLGSTLDIASRFESYSPTSLSVGASGGLNTTFVLSDNNTTLVTGVEYFYNSVGYDSEKYYPALIAQRAFQPFYVGQHYAAIYASLAPRALGETSSFVLSNLSNVSDLSFITRLDFFIRVLSYLSFEAFADVHYGTRGGEFRLELNIPGQQIGGVTIPAVFIPAPLFDLGIGVRIKI